ncbi:SpoIIE family protein phosphatase [Streptomyces sp. NA04227]|uniref:SpoIIE family protein phosphatase n=1 Tax=Streptomyces sp. NA04227 TaxID=2742136 RepID=UPI00159232BA|nr:SpoIIE family protein phosphatase [Streptomyces sp. NA04227]QKW10307.1 SpoIIE family protein phosphatase [Streptomyces sp. NA04227]
MSSSHSTGDATTPGSTRHARMRLLNALGDGGGALDVLAVALAQVTAEFGGLGGMAHLRVAATHRSGLRLMVSNGLPEAFIKQWENVSERVDVAPVRAVRSGRLVSLPTLRMPETDPRQPGAEPLSDQLPVDCGIVSAGLKGDSRYIGALSVVTPPGAAPGSERLEFLTDTAQWISQRLRLDAPHPDGLPRGLLQALESEGALRDTSAPSAVGAWEWDLETRRFRSDPRFAERLGLARTHFAQVEEWADLIHPDDLPHVVHRADAAIRGEGRYDVEYRVRCADGPYAWVHARAGVQADEEGRPLRMVGTVEETTARHAALEPVGRALRHMSDLFLSVDGDWRIEFVNAAAEAFIGTSAHLVGKRLWDLPALRAVPGLEERCRKALAGGGPTGFDFHWPPGDRWFALRMVPVPQGVTLYGTDITERHLHEAERARAEQSAAARAALVRGLTASLAEALTVRDVVEAVGRSVLSHFSAAGLLVAVREGERLRVLGSLGRPAKLVERIDGAVCAATPLERTVREHVPEFVESPQELSERFPGSAAAWFGEGAWAFLPLTASGRVGACVLAYDHPHRFDDDERALLTELSGLIAQALGRAVQYDEAAAKAEELQRALLPRTLPAHPSVATAVQYLPSGHGTEVGGDWYDVIALSADRVALVVGDVMGHGSPQAATMGSLRTAARTLSELELPPDEVLTRLGDIVAELGEDAFATCVYGIYDPVAGTFTHAGAGHPPPALLAPDGSVVFLEHTADPPLGAGTPPYSTVTSDVPDGSLLALYTDGLVESSSRDVDAGMTQLATALSGTRLPSTRASLDGLCEQVTTSLLPGRRPVGDDAVLLLARTRRLAPSDVANWSLPDEPQAAGRAREHVREQLAAWHLDDLLTTTTELIVSELVGNAVRHARGPIDLRLLRSRTLICEVSDGSLTTPHIRTASFTDEGGRGLQLIAAMAQRWGARYTAEGKSIWAEQALGD